MNLDGAGDSEKDFAMLSPKAKAELKRLLNPGERVLWLGRPVPSAAWADPMPGTITSRWACLVLYIITPVLALSSLLPLIVLLLGYTVDRLAGNFSAWDLVTLPIVAVLLLFAFKLLGLIFFPWISISLARRRSYVLTTRQAITIHETPQVVDFYCQDLGDVDAPTVTRTRKDGVGNVIFGGLCVSRMSGDGGMDMTAHYDTGFTACPDAERVAARFAEARLQRLPDREREDIEEMQRDYQGWLRRKGRL